MKVTFNDRISIMYGAILPPAASIATMKIATEIKNKVSFSEAERSELNLVVQQTGAISYRSTKPLSDYTLDVEFTNEDLNLLAAGAKRIDEAEQVTADMLDTVVKFMPV